MNIRERVLDGGTFRQVGTDGSPMPDMDVNGLKHQVMTLTKKVHDLANSGDQTLQKRVREAEANFAQLQQANTMLMEKYRPMELDNKELKMHVEKVEAELKQFRKDIKGLETENARLTAELKSSTSAKKE